MKFSFGIISSDTLRGLDIVEQIGFFAENYNLDKVMALCDEYLEIYNNEIRGDGLDDMEASSFIMDEIFDKMNNHAETNCWFGFHPYDSGLLGFWKSTGY